jgi:hypothetical protein
MAGRIPLLLGLAMGCALGAALLVGPVPGGVGLAFRWGLFPVLAAGILLLWPAFRLPVPWRDLLAPAFALVLFALPLSGLWSSGVSDGSIGGLLPWFDASAYYVESQRLLAGERLSDAVSRPWFVGLAAILQTLVQHNLQWTLALLYLAPAVASVLFSKAIARSLGPAAGVLLLLLLYLFLRPLSGSLLTEHLGLALGVLGVGGLWASGGSGSWAIGALFLLGAAQAARPGPLLLLPCVALGYALEVRPRPAARRLFAAGLAVALPFVLGVALTWATGSSSGGYDRRFPYILYGVVTGNTGWLQVFADHPEVRRLAEPELSQTVLALALDAARRHPLALAKGILRCWRDFLGLRWVGAFGFMTGGGWLRLPLWIFLGLGVFRCGRGREGPAGRLLLWALGGLLLSVPFVPPRDAGIRPYAAAVPLLALLAAVGMAQLTSRRRGIGDTAVPPPSPAACDAVSPGRVWVAWGVGLVAVILAGTFLIRLTARPIALPAMPPCAPGREVVFLRLAPGSFLRLGPDAASSTTHVPDVRIDDFRRGLRGFDPEEVAAALRQLPPGDVLANAYLFERKMSALFTAPGDLVSSGGLFGAACGRSWRTTSGWLFFRAEAVWALD